jgi:hypothetical protein
VFLDGPVTVQDAAGRRTFDLGGSAILNGQGWIEHDRLGYVLLDASDQTTVQAQFQRGTNGLALPVFSAWIDHGLAPQNATYAYAVVPGVTPDELDAYSQALPIQILANTAAVQAVQHLGLQQTQIAFYAAGSVRISDDLTISVDRPINLIIKQAAGDLTITAADPRQFSTAVTIYVSRQLSGPGVTLLADGVTSQITFALPSLRGSSATQMYHALAAGSLAEGESLPTVLVPPDAPPPQTSQSLSSYLASHAHSTTPATSTSAPSLGKPTTTFTPTNHPLAKGHGGPLSSDFLDPLAVDSAFSVWDDFSSLGQ